jgi:hypothetical protein
MVSQENLTGPINPYVLAQSLDEWKKKVGLFLAESLPAESLKMGLETHDFMAL